MKSTFSIIIVVLLTFSITLAQTPDYWETKILTEHKGLKHKIALIEHQLELLIQANEDTLIPEHFHNGDTSRGLCDTLCTIVIPIGDWNMDQAGRTNIPHGLGSDFMKVLSVTAIILQDNNNSVLYPLGTVQDNTVSPEGGVLLIGTHFVVLRRLMGGFFDNTNFNDTSFNRGWITIKYKI